MLIENVSIGLHDFVERGKNLQIFINFSFIVKMDISSILAYLFDWFSSEEFKQMSAPILWDYL